MAAISGGLRIGDATSSSSIGLVLREEFPDAGYHLRPIELDVLHHHVVRQAPHAVFQVESVRAEGGNVGRDLLRHNLRRSDVQRSGWADLVHERLLRRNGEPASLGDMRYDLQLARPEFFPTPFVRIPHVSGPMYPHLKPATPHP